MLRIILTGLVVLAASAAGVRGAEPIHGNVVLELEGAVSRGGDHRTDIELELPVRQGEWPEECWGYAVGFNRAHHEGVVAKNEVDGDVRKLTLEVTVGSDPWVEGGKAVYEVRLKRDGDGFAGAYTGTFAIGAKEQEAPEPKPRSDVPDPIRALLEKAHRQAEERGAEKDAVETVEVLGKVRGRIGPVWPGLAEAHEPLAPGEHPRLIFRQKDLGRMKQRAADTPEGRAIMDRFRAVLGKPPAYDTESDKFTNWPAVGYGFAYQMTGDKGYADRAREIIEQTMFANPSGRAGRGVSQDIHHAPRLLGFALAFDLSCDAWDPAFRTKCIDGLQRRVREVAQGEFQGNRMSGFNPNWWSNHNGIRAGAFGVGAIAVMGEKNSLGKEMVEAEHLADVAAREIRGYLRRGLGGSGYCLEGMFYKGMTIRRGFAHFLRAYPTALGRTVDPGPLGDFLLAGFFMEAEPGRFFPIPKPYDGLGGDLGVDGEDLRDVVFALTMNTVPPEMMPGVKWIHTRSVGLLGSRTFGIAHSFYGPYVLATYPFEVEAKPPESSFPWMAPDPRKGHYVFRPTFGDEQDILLVTNFKSETLPGCHFERAGPMSGLTLYGLGRKWLDGTYLLEVDGLPPTNEHHGPQVVRESRGADRTCVLELELDRAYLVPLESKKDKQGASADAPGAAGEASWPGSVGKYVDFGIRGRRSMAVDATGRAGAPLLVAILDRLERTGGEPVKATWRLPLDERAGAVRTDGREFTVGEAREETLTGVLAAGGSLEARKLTAETEGTALVVFTIQKGPAPAMRVSGEGLGTTVRVGRRTVRVEDGSIVLD